MNRKLATIAAAFALVAATAAPALAGTPPVIDTGPIVFANTPPVLPADVVTIDFCTQPHGNVPGLSCSYLGLVIAESEVWAATATAPAVANICSEHTFHTHAYRVAFCSGYAGVDPDVWGRAGLYDRANIVVGLLPGGWSA